MSDDLIGLGLFLFLSYCLATAGLAIVYLGGRWLKAKLNEKLAGWGKNRSR